VSQVGLDATTDSVLFFVTGGVSFCSGVDAPEVLDSEPKVTPPSLVYTPSDLTSAPDGELQVNERQDSDSPARVSDDELYQAARAYLDLLRILCDAVVVGEIRGGESARYRVIVRMFQAFARAYDPTEELLRRLRAREEAESSEPPLEQRDPPAEEQ